VRDLFREFSPYTAGPDAGKVDEDGLDNGNHLNPINNLFLKIMLIIVHDLFLKTKTNYHLGLWWVNYLSVVFKKVKRFTLDPDKSSYQYFDLLDRDGDGLLSF